MKNTKIETPEVQEDKKLNLKVVKVMAVFLTVIFAVSGVKAMFVDTALETLNNNLQRSLERITTSETRRDNRKAEYEQSEKDLAQDKDLACEAWKALKSYKDSKKIPLENPEKNLCVELKAHQEGF